MSTFNYYFCDNKNNVMTNILEKDKKEEMRSHIAQARVIIEQYLPSTYTQLVLNRFAEDSGITSGIIRNVKKGLSNRLDVLNAMVEVALEQKKLVETFKKNTQKN